MSHDGATLVGLYMQWDTTPPYDHTTEAAIWRMTNGGYEMFRVADLLRHQNVDLQGWRLTEVNDVSADGRILIGKGVSPDGVGRSWYAVLNVVPVPEPESTVMLVTCGLLLTSRLRRPQGREGD
jgi:hypothetical protein